MYRKISALLLALLLLLSLASCARDDSSSMGLSNPEAADKVTDDEAAILVKGDTYPLTIRDFLNEETVLEKPFERPAVLSGTPLNIWYDLGGKSVCTSDISDNLRLVEGSEDEIKALPAVGPVYNINLEAVIEHDPDFIVCQVGTQSTQGKKLRDMGYPVVHTHVRSFDDVCDTYTAFGKILGAEDLAAQRVAELKERRDALATKAPQDGKSVVILYISGFSLAAKLDNSIAGDIAQILGLKNICSDLPPDAIGSEHTPLDVEYILQQDPDIVLVTSMVDSNELAQQAMQEEFEKNPVWYDIPAIKEGRILYLPQQYFLFNAGPYYGDAIEYMARGVYPEIYGSLEDFETFED